MVEQISGQISDALVDNELILQHEREEYKYALICNIETSISFGSIILLSVLFRVFIPTVFFLISFLTIRKRCGGFHFNSFFKCYFSSVLIYIVIVVISLFKLDYTVINLLMIVASVVLIYFGAVNHPNMNYSKEELMAAKESSRLLVVLFDIIAVVLNYFKVSYRIIYYMETGVIFCAILLLLSKITNQEVKENG